MITDDVLRVSIKFQKGYDIENWCHLFACSNSLRALKIENDDRRWFIPEVAEVPWPAERFVRLRKWLEGGGLGIIKRWAETYSHYVGPEEHAPSTERKKEMVEGSRSDALKEAVHLARAMNERTVETALTVDKVRTWLQSNAHVGKMFDTNYEIKKGVGART